MQRALQALIVATLTAAPVGHCATILDLQRYARSTTIDIEDSAGRTGTATLTSLNPAIDAWFVLSLEWSDAAEPVQFHLENPRPHVLQMALDATDRQRLHLAAAGRDTRCDLWWGGTPSALERASRTGVAYAPLCDDALYLRNSVPGNYTQLERTTNFLRDRVWGGDRIVTLVRETLFRDAYKEAAQPSTSTANPAATRAAPDGPQPARIDTTRTPVEIRPEHLGLDFDPGLDTLQLGAWYAVRNAPGVFVSALQPNAIAPQLLDSYRDRVSGLDGVEGEALDYFVAFDLSAFAVGFALGTDHPRLGWSPRIPENMRDPTRAGPDGIDAAVPLVRTGLVSPALAERTIATFTGGFKREHGAFRRGGLAQRNGGSHYGFIEQGTVFSTLQPGLATFFVLDDGSVNMKTWSGEDNALLPRIRHARQNGVALIDAEPVTGRPVPGALVNQWGAGNWSGSEEEKLRTLRAGVCLQQTATRPFLIYGYFSTATPSAMARAFQAYGCQYAMHLDMNALEHTYLAVYTRRGSEIVVQHLIEGMTQLDRMVGANTAPRFLAVPDNRDFFYVMRREAAR